MTREPLNVRLIRAIEAQLQLCEAAEQTPEIKNFRKLLRRSRARIVRSAFLAIEGQVLICRECGIVAIVGPFESGKGWLRVPYSCGHMSYDTYCPRHPEKARRPVTIPCMDCDEVPTDDG